MKITLIGLVLACSLSFACGGTPTSEELCARVAECENQPSAADCVEELEEMRSTSEQAGCGGEYDDYISCLDGVSDVCSQEALQSECLGDALALFTCVGLEDDEPG
jgi:hypothetical protein